ncbi:MAG TPA: DUF2461 domain-containing protein [Ornithinimicrobium sp.]|nr:DUF2461 domain-containing protein [Ornithinimicrobium sp.]
MPFTGVPHAATAFYAELEEDNSRSFWSANAGRFERDVRGPMASLLEELSEEFGAGRIFRPHRDVRFSQDKSPFKTHQGIFVPVGRRTGWYAEVSADGFRVGGGCYHLEPAALAAYRRAVDGPRGARLETVTAQLEAAGWEITGDALRTAPRGYPRDHPRIGLLRRRSLAAVRWIEDGSVVRTPLLAYEVRADWRRLRPLVEWLREVAGGES